jgi:hypothetical protein
MRYTVSLLLLLAACGGTEPDPLAGDLNPERAVIEQRGGFCACDCKAFDGKLWETVYRTPESLGTEEERYKRWLFLTRFRLDHEKVWEHFEVTSSSECRALMGAECTGELRRGDPGSDAEVTPITGNHLSCQHLGLLED